MRRHVWVENRIGSRAAPPPSLDMAFIYNLFLVQNWGTNYSIILASWSISTELAAYIVFPFLLTIAVQSRQHVAVITLLVSIAAICTVASVHYDLPHNGPLDVWFDFSPWPMVRCLSEFTIGLISFRASAELQSHTIPVLLYPKFASLVLVAAIIGLLFFPKTDLALIAVFALLIVTISIDEQPVNWLASRPLFYLDSFHTRYIFCILNFCG